ncbi:MAG: FkbM family methyltransferase [Sedimentisphaerales bacterium]|nr:FkbM family methyltransferase [Sedimentisphaerales bacterium]
MRLLQKYLLKKPPQAHRNKYEAVWKLFRTKHPAIIVEIGSYNGKDSLELSRMFPCAKVFTFEADSSNFEIVRNNVSVRRQITAINKAVFSHTGSVTFYKSKGTDDSSAFRGSGSCLEPTEKLKKTWPKMTFDEQIEVGSITLADWAKENNFDSVDFIWMDAQGAELAILQGAENLLASAGAILLEVWQEAYYKGTGCYKENREYLASHGFREAHCWFENDSGDVLFINEKAKNEIS